MNAIMERWVKTLRGELLDRTLIWTETHLRHVLKVYEQHSTSTRISASALCSSTAMPKPSSSHPSQLRT